MTPGDLERHYDVIKCSKILSQEVKILNVDRLWYFLPVTSCHVTQQNVNFTKIAFSQSVLKLET